MLNGHNLRQTMLVYSLELQVLSNCEIIRNQCLGLGWTTNQASDLLFQQPNLLFGRSSRCLFQNFPCWIWFWFNTPNYHRLDRAKHSVSGNLRCLISLFTWWAWLSSTLLPNYNFTFILERQEREQIAYHMKFAFIFTVETIEILDVT